MYSRFSRPHPYKDKTVVEASIPFEKIKLADQGLYVWVNPDANSICSILDVLRSAPCDTKDSTELHCTVIYAKETKGDTGLNLVGNNHGTIANIDAWIDHKQRWILVMKVESEDLRKVHQSLLDAGYDHSFPTYDAHITVAKGVDMNEELKMWLAEVNATLRLNPMQVQFGEVQGSYLA